MDDDQRPAESAGTDRTFGQRRRGGRPRGPQQGGGGGFRSPAPQRDFVPRPRPAAMPEPETVRPARELLEALLEKMGVTGARVRYYARSEGEYLEIDGPDLANLIGRHGHTLEALNLIFNNMVNAGVKKDRHYFTIDAEGYRARRADLLKSLALQTLERAIREKRSISLEPMLPSERKVIHLALADNPYVSTESSGVEPERRVVVIRAPAEALARAMNGNDADAATIAAIATAPGRGAIAIVRVSGPAADAIASALTGGRPLRPRVAERVRLRAPDGASIDRGLALRFPAPHSYTGDDVVEFHVHGSPAVARETLLAALAAGARLARPGEFTRRAFEAGKLDLCAAEAVGDLIAAEHRGAARGAAARLSGGLASAIDAERARLAETLEELSAALDFPDEVEAPTPAAFARRLGDVDAALADLAISWERGRLVREGCSIAIVGPPNVGKSSLLNALLGVDRALVSPAAGTTRDTVEEQVALGDGIVGRLVDTAGLRDGADALEAAGIERARRALAEASVALVVVDGSRTLDPDARALVSATRDRARVVLYNKLDLGDDGYIAREAPERDALAGSVRERSTVDGVRAALAAAAGSDGSDLARPHLGTVRQADAVMTARRALAFALETATTGQPIDLAAGDVAAACAALGELTGRAASEAVLDRVFARFCIGK